MTTVWTLEPKVRYDITPAPQNSTLTGCVSLTFVCYVIEWNPPMRNSITPDRTAGNFLGSFIASVMGITRPIPSNENTAVLNAS
jgi:hypothetical protein